MQLRNISNLQRCSLNKVVLKTFTGKHLCQSLFFNKVPGAISFLYFLKISENLCVFRGYRNKTAPTTLLKMRLWNRYFSVNFAKFLRTPFSQNTSRRLLLGEFYFKCSLFDLKNNFGILSNKHVPVQSQQWKHQNNVGNAFKISLNIFYSFF